MKRANSDSLNRAVEDAAWALDGEVHEDGAKQLGMAVQGLMPHEALYVVAKALMLSREDDGE